MGLLRYTQKNIRSMRNGNGVYLIFDRKKKLRYVGRASNGNVKHQLSQHFGSSHYTGAKFGGRKDNFFDIKYSDGTTARKMEADLIRKNKPDGNSYFYGAAKTRRTPRKKRRSGISL